jgi:hypothetical protein
LAEPSYYTGVLASTAAASKRHLALFNAAGSGRIVKVYSIVAAPAPTAAVTGLVVVLHALRITTVPTGGSGLTFGKSDTVEDSTLPAQITAMTGATGGAAESGPPFGVATVSGEETQSGASADLYRVDGLKPIVLREGEGMLIKQGALASAGAINTTVGFTAL